MLRKIQNLLLLVFLFLLPWQTRYIWHYGQLNHGYWEYGTFSIYATEILLWAIIILFAVDNGKKLKLDFSLLKTQKKSVFLLAVLLLVFVSSLLASINLSVSYNYIFHILEGVVLMVALAWQNEKIKYQIALWAGAAVQGALAIWQFLTQHVWVSKWLGMAEQEASNLGPSVIEFADQRWLRAYGSFGSPNSLGIYLAVLFMLGLVLYLKTESSRTKILISAGQLFILSGLLVSFSRGAWLAAALGAASLFAIIFFKHHRHQSPSPLLGERQREGYTTYNNTRTNTPPLAPPPTAVRRGPAVAVVKGEGGHDAAAGSLGMTLMKSFAKQIGFALAVIIFWLIIFYPVFTARFNLSNRLELKSISERKGQYAEALSFIKANSVLGVGPGAYTYALYKKYPTWPAWQYQPIHNIYLLALVEIGLAGVIFLFFLFKRLFWLMIKNNLIYLPVVGSLLAAGLFDHWLWSMYTGMALFWLIVGLGFSKE